MFACLGKTRKRMRAETRARALDRVLAAPERTASANNVSIYHPHSNNNKRVLGRRPDCVSRLVHNCIMIYDAAVLAAGQHSNKRVNIFALVRIVFAGLIECVRASVCGFWTCVPQSLSSR